MSMAGHTATRGLVIMFFACARSSGAASGAGFLSQDGAGSVQSTSASTVSTEELELSLRTALEGMVGRAAGIWGAPKLSAMEASLAQTFWALPKNALGRLSPRGVRYLVHSYFAKEHGWLIKGLEPHGNRGNVTELQDVSVLQDRAPALVEAALEARRSNQGLSLDDVVVMVATLERLIFDGSLDLLRVAYELNMHPSHGRIDREALREVLVSYLVIYAHGGKYNLSNVREHFRIRDRIITRQDFLGYENDAVLNHDFENRGSMNPFVIEPYSFTEATRIVANLASSYGKWQNADCVEMKANLLTMAKEGTGRVPLGRFYSQPADANFAFSESVEYLRKIGALDEARAGRPQVMIANYINGPSNCVAHSSYYSVCCINECEAIMNQIESEIRAPRVHPGRILDVVSNISSSTVDAPRRFPRALTRKLREIARGPGGEVMLHGRLFAQWLHFAFPNECPYPTVVAGTEALTPGHWFGNRAKSASQQERDAHVQAELDTTAATGSDVSSRTSRGSDHTGAEFGEVTEMAGWNDDEVLILNEPAGLLLGSGQWWNTRLSSLFRCSAQLGLCVAVLILAGGSIKSVAEARKGNDRKPDRFSQLFVSSRDIPQQMRQAPCRSASAWGSKEGVDEDRTIPSVF